jgi:hypothetical protein
MARAGWIAAFATGVLVPGAGLVAREPRAREWAEEHLLDRTEPCPQNSTGGGPTPSPGATVRIAANSTESRTIICENPDGSLLYHGERDGLTIWATASYDDGVYTAVNDTTRYVLMCGGGHAPWLEIYQNGKLTDSEPVPNGCHRYSKYAGPIGIANGLVVLN